MLSAKKNIKGKRFTYFSMEENFLATSFLSANLSMKL